MHIPLLLLAFAQGPTPPAGRLPPNKAPPVALDAAQIARALDAHAQSPRPVSIPESAGPLTIAYSDYTINLQGQVILDGGFSPAEEAHAQAFFDKMQPVVEALYGPPYTQYTLTIVRDLQYSGTNIFIPLTLEIHTAALIPLDAQLITHELLHAWRWQRTVTMDLSSPYLYNPTLSGFEEGMAQGGSYAALNAYTAIYGQGDPHVGYFYWLSDNDRDYDLRNDGSMATAAGFFSDSGATWKYFDRYEQGAAAFLKLHAVIPSFFSAFNAAWYAYVDQAVAANPRYKPTRAELVALMATYMSTVDAMPVSAWVDRQRILDCVTTPGKKVWIWREWWTPTWEPASRVHYVETFPNGSEWATYLQVPPGPGWLYHRLNLPPVSGTLVVWRSWDGFKVTSANCTSEDMPWWAPAQACGPYNCAAGIGFEFVMFTETNPGPGPFPSPSPIIFYPKPQTGLYKLKALYRNPHYGQTAYGFPYDLTQASAELVWYQPVTSNAEAAASMLVGGIVGADAGSIMVQHLSVPGVSATVPVTRGLFLVPFVPGWLQAELGGTLTMARPGVLRFIWTPQGGSQQVWERAVGAGSPGGGRVVLLGQ